MEDSTADAAAANAGTLRQRLKKIMTEIVSDGGEIKDHGETDGSIAVLEAIDETIRILNRLRVVESKIPESDIPVTSSSPSPKVEVPKEFKCTLSNAIMIEPVIIASGQTYEKRYITQWLRHERTCPRTKEDLSHCWWAPNHLVDELITQWCRVNRYDRLKPSDEIVSELFIDGIESLLQRISSPSSVEDQTEAAKELRCQTKRFPNVRRFFATELPDSISRLLSPLSALGETVHSNPELQEYLVTTLFNISIVVENKTLIVKNPCVIPLLGKSLKQGTSETQRNSAATLLSLLDIESNKLIIGRTEVFRALIYLIKAGDSLASSEAASVVFSLCHVKEFGYRDEAVSAGLIFALTHKIKEGSNAADLLAVLALFSTHERAIHEMEELGFYKYLLSILRKPSCSETWENAVTIVYDMCSLDTPHRNRVRRMTLVDEEENQYGTFSLLARQGSDDVAGKAEAILKWVNRYGTGKEPQME